MQEAYLVDIGVLRLEGDPEFEAYAVAYDCAYGYYDENQYYCLSRERAVAEAQDYVDEGPELAYGIVTITQIDADITEQDLADGNVDVSDEKYLVEDVVFAVAKIDGEVGELNFA